MAKTIKKRTFVRRMQVMIKRMNETANSVVIKSMLREKLMAARHEKRAETAANLMKAGTVADGPLAETAIVVLTGGIVIDVIVAKVVKAVQIGEGIVEMTMHVTAAKRIAGMEIVGMIVITIVMTDGTLATRSLIVVMVTSRKVAKTSDETIAMITANVPAVPRSAVMPNPNARDVMKERVAVGLQSPVGILILVHVMLDSVL